MKKVNSLKLIEKLIIFTFPFVFFLFIDKYYYSEKSTETTTTPESETKEKSDEKLTKEENRFLSTQEVGTLFDDEIISFIITQIKNSKKEIKGVTYTFSNKNVAKELKKAAERGITVSLFYGKESPRKDVPGTYLRNMNRGILHEKFMIIDDLIIVSSSNLSSDKSSNSAVWFRKAPRLKKLLEKEIADLFAPVYMRKCEKGCNFEYGKIYFSPGRSCSDIKKELMKAKKETFLALYTVTIKNPMMSGIKKQLSRNIKVTSIVDDWKFEENSFSINKKACSYIKNRGGKCKMWNEKEQGKKFHHKFALIDNKKLIFGSMNWTSSGCYKNREIMIVTENENIVSEFAKYKEKLRSSFGL